MKTKFIQLENTDNLPSIRDKLRWARTNRILLMLPEKGLSLDKLELNLIKRYGNALGSQIAILTHDEEIRLIALELKIPVFLNLRSAQIKSWNRRSR